MTPVTKISRRTSRSVPNLPTMTPATNNQLLVFDVNTPVTNGATLRAHYLNWRHGSETFCFGFFFDLVFRLSRPRPFRSHPLS